MNSSWPIEPIMLSTEKIIKYPNRILYHSNPSILYTDPRNCHATRARLPFFLKHEAEKTVHLDPLPSALLEITIHHALNGTKSGPVEFD